MASEWTVAVGGEELFGVKLKSGRDRPTKIICQDIGKVSLSLVPAFITDTNTTQDENRLLRVLQVSSSTARFVEVVEMHTKVCLCINSINV